MRPVTTRFPFTTAAATLRFVVGLLAIAALAAACGGDESVAAGSEPDGGQGSGGYDGQWTLVDGEIDGNTFTPLADYAITLDIEGDQIGGSAGCNSFGGGVTIDGTSLEVGDVAITEMACLDQAAMDAEQTFIQALWAATTIERNGSGADERLILGGDGITLTYAPTALVSPPEAAAELVGTLWILDTIIEGDAASSILAGAEEPTLALASDESFTAMTGCRELRGRYTLDGDRVSLMFDMDDWACEGDIGRQEIPILTVFEQSGTAEVDGKRLTITADDGRHALSFKAAE
jgi:heat shock protein HslJ